MDFPDFLISKIQRMIKPENDVNIKIKIICEQMKEVAGNAFISTDLEDIFHIMIKRLNLIIAFIRTKRSKLNAIKTKIGKKWLKKTGKLFIIKPYNFNQGYTGNNSEDLIKNTRQMLTSNTENVFIFKIL